MTRTGIAAALLLWAASARAQTLRVRVVDQDGKPVAAAVVYAVGASSPAATAPSEVVMDLADLDFRPHVLAVPAGTRVRFPNKDQVQHQLYSFSKAKRFELPLYKGREADPVLFDTPGVVKIGCNIHDWMLGYVVVTPDASFGVTGEDGRADLPLPSAGALTLWSERLRGEAPTLPVSRIRGGSAILRITTRGPAHRPAHHALAPY